MNRGVKLLIMAAVLVVAVVAVVIVAKVTAPEILPMASESGETILQIKAADVKNIKWTYGSESFDFDYTGDSWKCNIQEGYMPLYHIWKLFLHLRPPHH